MLSVSRSLRSLTNGVAHCAVAMTLLAGCAAREEAAEAPSAARRVPERIVAYGVAMPDGERERFEETLRGGLVVVRMGDAPSILYGCHATVGYRFRATAPARDSVNLRGYEASAAKLPFGALPPEMARGDRQDMTTEVVGTYEASRRLGDGDWFDGKCTGGTHYVTAVSVGSFGESAPAGACATAALEGVERPGCDRVVRIELEPLPHAPCPRYTVARAGSCRADAEGVAPPGREPFQVSQQGASLPGLAPGQVEEFVRPREGEVRRACWDGRYDSWDEGTAHYGFAVDPGGRVFDRTRAGEPPASAELRRGDAATTNAELAKCVERLVSAWTFPSANTPTWLLVNFRFGPAPGPAAR